MINIPPHYTDGFILQRYNKALNIVKHLPANSKFQPTKSQKLELYALYKQVSQGNVDTQRPGLFDVVGRAKWDAWKKLEGLTVLEARHTYVEALLRAATEAYKKNIGREEAQQIIHTFAIMKPSGENTESELETDTSTQEDDEDDEDQSVDSQDTEELAYLRDIQESSDRVVPFVLNDNTTPYGSPDRQSTLSKRTQSPFITKSLQQQQLQQQRPPSVASTQTMMTAPNTPLQRPSRPPSVSNQIRPRSAVSSRLGQSRGNEKRPQPMTRDDLHVLPEKAIYDEGTFDGTVNPWAQQSTSRLANRRRSNSYSSEDEENSKHSSQNDASRRPSSSLHPSLSSPKHFRRQKRPNSMASPSPHTLSSIAHLQSPIRGSSASSSVTATQSNFATDFADGSRHGYTPTGSRSSSRNQSSHVSITSHFNRSGGDQNASALTLGPATKRALESLQGEVVALNDRVDGLRKELVERDRQRVIQKKSEGDDKSDDIGDGWRWVIKAALKYAGVNLLTAFVLFFLLYKNGSPIAYVVLKQVSKFWQAIRLRVLISNVVV